MKILLCVFFTAVMVLSGIGAQGHEPALIDALSGASAMDRGWRFLISVSGDDWQELHHTSRWGDNWQYSTIPDADGLYHSLYVSDSKVLADIGLVDFDTYAIAAVFTAPQGGLVTIPSWRHVFFDNYNDISRTPDGLVVRPTVTGEAFAIIQHNEMELYCAANSSDAMIASEEMTIMVEAGDTIWFIAEPIDINGIMLMNDIAVLYSTDTLALENVILDIPRQFGGEGFYVLRENFRGNNVQGPEWFYLKRFGDGSWEELIHFPAWGDNWQAFANPQEEAIFYSIFEWNGVGAQTGFDLLQNIPFEIAAAFRAPQAGSYIVPPFRHIMFSGNDYQGGRIVYQSYTQANTFAVEVRVNNTTKYFQRLSGGYQESPELQFNLRENDMVYFIFRAMELNDVNADTPSMRMDDIQIGLAGSTFTPWSAWYDISAEDLPIPARHPSDPAVGSGGAGLWLIVIIGAAALIVLAIIMVMRKKKN